MRAQEYLAAWNGSYVMVQIDDGCLGHDQRPRLLFGRLMVLEDALQLQAPGWVEVIPLAHLVRIMRPNNQEQLGVESMSIAGDVCPNDRW